MGEGTGVFRGERDGGGAVGRRSRGQTKTPAQGPAFSKLDRGWSLVQLERGPGPGDVQADLTLDRPGLQRERLVRAADQPVAAKANAEGGFGRGAHIGAGEGMLGPAVLFGGEHEPGDLGADGEADVDAELLDRARVMLGLAALGRLEVAG